MNLNLEDMTTLINALDKYIADINRDAPTDLAIAISLHNNLLDEIKAKHPDAGILKPYHEYL